MLPSPTMTTSAGRDSERRFRAYFDLPLVGIGISGPDKRWIEVNGKLCDLFGFSREELLRSTWDELTHPEDLDENITFFEQVLSGERDGYSLEKRFVHKTGRTIYTLLSAQCLRDVHGAVESFVVVINDITELKRTERRYRQLFELAPCGILVEDAKGKILDFNPELCRIFGESREAMVGQSISALTTHSTETVASHMKETIEKGGHAREVVNRRADGTEVHFAIREVPIPLEDGSPGVLVISLNITKRKEIEKALQKSEARFRTLAEHVRMIPFEADAATCNFEYVGPQAESVFGFPRDAWYEAEFWFNKLHPDDRQNAIEACHRCSRSLTDYEFEYRMIDVDGSTVWIRDIVHVVRENNQPVKMTGFLLDVTEQRKAEQRTRELEARMAHASRLNTAGELMAGIVHELNQPLYAVLNYASACRNTLRASGNDSTEVQKLLGQIVEQAHRAGRTLNEMLRFVRRDSPDRSPADIAHLIAETVSMMESESRRRQIVLSSESEPNLPTVSANRVQLQQVVVNLLQNAFDACAETEDVTGQVKVDAFQEGANVVIRVEDNGSGIPPQDIPHILNAFYSTKPEGVGIGLAISKTIVEAHDGRIEVANRKTGGAVFRVVLPAWYGTAQPK